MSQCTLAFDVLVECECVAPVWTWHSAVWRQFGLTFKWTTLSNLDNLAVTPPHQHIQEPLRKLWVLLAAVTLHTLRTHRNKTCFENKLPPISRLFVKQQWSPGAQVCSDCSPTQRQRKQNGKTCWKYYPNSKVTPIMPGSGQCTLEYL